ncbi:hypothetical protein FQZ97_1057280 [compost metagenome]
MDLRHGCRTRPSRLAVRPVVFLGGPDAQRRAGVARQPEPGRPGYRPTQRHRLADGHDPGQRAARTRRPDRGQHRTRQSPGLAGAPGRPRGDRPGLCQRGAPGGPAGADPPCPRPARRTVRHRRNPADAPPVHRRAGRTDSSARPAWSQRNLPGPVAAPRPTAARLRPRTTRPAGPRTGPVRTTRACLCRRFQP